MNSRKVIALCLVFNMAWLALVAGVFVWAQPARAQGAPSAPSQPMAGPYYASYVGNEFQTWVNGVDDYSIKQIGFSTQRVNGGGVGLASTGLHLPQGAIVTALTNDSAVNSPGYTKVLLLRCAINDVNCPEYRSIEDHTPGRAQATNTFDQPLVIDNQNWSYFLQIFLPDDSGFYNAIVQYSVPSSFLFMPAIQH